MLEDLFHSNIGMKGLGSSTALSQILLEDETQACGGALNPKPCVHTLPQGRFLCKACCLYSLLGLAGCKNHSTYRSLAGSIDSTRRG